MDAVVVDEQFLKSEIVGGPCTIDSELSKRRP
jgi:hypothetical protein